MLFIWPHTCAAPWVVFGSVQCVVVIYPENIKFWMEFNMTNSFINYIVNKFYLISSSKKITCENIRNYRIFWSIFVIGDMLTKLYVNINSNLAKSGGQAEQTKLHFGKNRNLTRCDSLPPLDWLNLTTWFLLLHNIMIY